MNGRISPHPLHILIIVAVLLILPAWSGCVQERTTYTGEIRNYNGQNLSSISDFRENSIKGPQHINNTTYRLRISGLVSTPKTYTIGDVIDNHTNLTKVVTLNCVEGWSVKILWQGILIKDLLNESRPLPNATTVTLTAYDGYTSSFPLSYFTNGSILLAYKMNNLTIPPERGYPFQLVAEGKWGYKWVKWVTDITLTDSSRLSGYWEDRGYSDSGDLNQSFIG
jgi:DMSO/TMAO reductase YedYZ molybdopterin-dependent catalytic subunit